MSALIESANGADPHAPAPPEADNEARGGAGEAGGFHDEVMALLPRARQELSLLDRQRGQLDRQLSRAIEALRREHDEGVAQIEARRREALAVLKAFGQAPKRAAPQKRSGTGGGGSGRSNTKASDHMIATILEYILTHHATDKFTILGLHEEMGATWRSTTTRVVCAGLRDAQILGKADKETREPGTGMPRWRWRILDREAGEQILAKLKAETNGQD